MKSRNGLGLQLELQLWVKVHGKLEQVAWRQQRKPAHKSKSGTALAQLDPRERETQLKRVQEREREGNSCERCQRCWAKRESQLQSQYSMHSFWQAGDNVLELETLIGLSLPRPRLSFSLSLFPHNQCNLITKAAQAIRHVKQLLHPEMQIQIDKSRFLTVTGLGQVSVSVSDYWSTVKGSSLYIFGFLSSKFAVGVFVLFFLVKVSHKCMQPQEQQWQQQ